jgi:DNA mismatch endonuclease (patch repair protein)
MPDNLTSAQRSRTMRAVRTKGTAPELLVRSLVHRLGYRFSLHRKDLIGTPDIVLPARNCVMFVHGCYWHGHKCARGKPSASNIEFWQRKISNNKLRDRKSVRTLREEGWRVLTIWQCETKDRHRLQQTILRFLREANVKIRIKARA